jgi:DNA (cytosine-5)-methyltransferase 1
MKHDGGGDGILTHVSLFTGIGGLDLAAEAAGFQTVLQVERDPYALRILEKHWPQVRRITDVREVSRESYEGEVTLISGGFPCQPFSTAGKRRGTEDDRYLWPEMLRVVREFQPTFVVAENVSGLLTIDNGMEIERVCTGLEDTGYEVLTFHYPAASVGAPHKRDRFFIVANTHCTTIPKKPDWWKKRKHQDRPEIRPLNSAGGKAMADSNGVRVERQRTKQQTTRSYERSQHDGRRTESIMGGMAHGIPDWLDGEPAGVPRVATGVANRAARLKALGNAVVPAQAYPIFAAIAHTEVTR